MQSIATYHGVNGKRLQEHYKDYLSDFKTWSQRSHAKKCLLFPQNIGKYLFINETSLSDGELYTILASKVAKRKKGNIVAIVAGT